MEGFFGAAIIQKPIFPVDHVIASQPVNNADQPGFVNVTFAVYGTNGEPVNSQTEVFAHSTDPDLTLKKGRLAISASIYFTSLVK
jgi:hypothetical protein